MALILGALMIQGVAPGPQLIREHPDIFWGLIASMWIGNLMLLVLNLPLVGVWIKLLAVPYRLLFPAIFVFCCIGVYTVDNKVFDVYVLAALTAKGRYAIIAKDVDPTIGELVKIRASQINHCAFCLDMHWKDARAA